MMKAAREFLGLSQDDVAAVSGLSRKTIQRVEKNIDVDKHYVAALQRFYVDQGITFLPPRDGAGWGMLNSNMKGDGSSLNGLATIPPSRRKKSTV